VNSHDVFGAWEAELAKFGFAIIHNKIVVIDPFSDDCVVVTGSHNLGFRASHNNDENMVIVRGHRGLAEAYACHVLDLYDHYAWRFLLNKQPDVFGQPLEADDKWQERYIQGPDIKSPELRFWLAAAGGTVASASPKPPAKPVAKPKAPSKPPATPSPASAAPADAAPAKKKPAAKKPRTPKAARTAPKKAAKAKKVAKKTKKVAKKPAKKSAKKAAKKAVKKAPKKAKAKAPKKAKKKAGKNKR
jgi:PLD-like domain